ncbi:MAG: universal stress protein [Candidatus Atribacteria bacterium]|nr:universal stress protein [Candidatus Atribacteria bacterium]
MKILVCVYGSEQSKKALEEATVIAEGCKASEVALIHVYEPKLDIFYSYEGITQEQIELFQEMKENQKKEIEKILLEALTLLEEKNLKGRTILKEGHPSHIIVEVAREEGFDMIVLGSRGLGGLKKLFLGSVSNAVLQEAHNCSVLIVK